MYLLPAALMVVFDWLLNAMQASILLPMAVVWWRRHHFPAPVRRLSWYVYLSLFSVVGARFFYIGNPPSNWAYLIAFNCGKLALLGAVYYQVLVRPNVRQLVLALTAAALLGMVPIIYYDANLAVTMSRVAQCTLLTGFALLYLEQYLDRPTAGTATHDPLCLVSIGQLLFSALTVTAFILVYFDQSAGTGEIKFLFLSLGGLVFNWFLTLAFLRATRPASAVPNEPGPSSFRVKS